jgi:hypothetical protein
MLRTSSGTPITFESPPNFERMRLTSGGNLGIGTTTPAARLDIVGGDPTMIVRNTSGTSKITLVGSNGTEATGMLLTHHGTIEQAIYSSNTLPFYIYTNGSRRLTILSNGNTGVGTTTPAYTLDVCSSATAASINMTTWPRYAASLTHNVRGTISNAFNGGASNATFCLVFRTPAIALDTNLGTVTNDTAYGTYFVCKRSGLWNLTFQAHGGNQNTSIAIDISTNVQDNENPGGVAARALAWLTMGYFVGSVTYTGYLPSNDNLYYKFKCNNNVLSQMQSNTWMTITFLGEQPTSASTWPR